MLNIFYRQNSILEYNQIGDENEFRRKNYRVNKKRKLNTRKISIKNSNIKTNAFQLGKQQHKSRYKPSKENIRNI